MRRRRAAARLNARTTRFAAIASQRASASLMARLRLASAAPPALGGWRPGAGVSTGPAAVAPGSRPGRASAGRPAALRWRRTSPRHRRIRRRVGRDGASRPRRGRAARRARSSGSGRCPRGRPGTRTASSAAPPGDTRVSTGAAPGSPPRDAAAAAASRSQVAERHDRVVHRRGRAGPARRSGAMARVALIVRDAMAARPEVDPGRQPGERIGDRVGDRQVGEAERLAGQPVRVGRARSVATTRRDPRVGGGGEDRPDARPSSGPRSPRRVTSGRAISARNAGQRIRAELARR